MKRLFTLLFLGLAAVAHAKPLRLDPSKPIDRYAITVWRDTSGLPVDSVGSVAQTPDGYLWLATEHGLVRFDGVRFTVFTRQNTPALKSNEIFSLFVSSDGTLWAGTRGGGAITVRGDRFMRVPIKLRFIVAFAESGDGAVWIGAPGGLARFHGGEYTMFGEKEGYPGGALTSLAGDTDGVYLGLPAGVTRIGLGGARNWTAADGLSGGCVTSLLMTSRGLLAGNTNGGVDRLVNGRFEPFISSVGSFAITSMIEGEGGSLWMSTTGGGIIRSAKGAIERLTSDNGLTSNSVNQILEDDEGNLWAPSIGGGLVRLHEGKLTTVEPKQPLEGEWILPLMQARDGNVWFATNGRGLHRLAGDSMKRFTREDGLKGDMISALEEGSDGSIWVGSETGLQRFMNGRFVDAVKGSELEGSRIYAITSVRDGSMWVSAKSGLFHIVNGAVRKIRDHEKTGPGPVIAIREAADGSLWFGRPGAVEHLVGEKLTRFGRAEGLQTNKLYGLTLDAVDGSVWIATGGDGLARIHEEKIRTYGVDDGLLCDTAYNVVQDREGNLWVPTSFGLFRIERSDLKAFDSGEIQRLPVDTFRKADGLKSSDFSGGFDRAGFRASDGKLWFPTTRGLVVVDPENLRVDSSPPRVLIENIRANDVSYGAHGATIELPRMKRNIEVDYSSPAFYSPESTTFRYMLEDFDEQWHDAGPRRTAYFTKVPPGRYRFRVQATTAAGVMREVSTGIEIVPRFHETNRFKGAVVLFLILLILLVFRRRFDKIHRQQEAVRKSEEHFRSLIEHGSDMILSISADDVIHYASPSVSRALGLPTSRLEGMQFGELVDDSAAGNTFLSAVRTRRRHSAMLLFRDADEQLHEVESIGALCADDGRVILNCRDITERRRLETQLAQANRLAGLGRLAATVSHEFNNVLMGIQPFVDIIRRKTTDRTTENATLQITKSIKRGKSISEEILTFTRTSEPVRRPLRVHDWLTELEIEIRALVGSNVRVGLIADHQLTLDGDVGQLSQVLTNLAINARDAGATMIRIEAGRVETAVFPYGVIHEPARQAHIRFVDNGGGIPASILPNIFEPLFTTKTTKGTGLGLAVAHKIVASHGGDIFAESVPGRGTTFHLFLPLAHSIASEAGPVVENPSPITMTPPCRILLVEDDSSVAEGILSLLEGESFEVALAINGNDALHMIPLFKPDIAILDVGLPDIDGTELYRRIVDRWPDVGIIFSTGHGDMTALPENATAPAFLIKPYSIEDLMQAIATVAEARLPGLLTFPPGARISASA